MFESVQVGSRGVAEAIVVGVFADGKGSAGRLHKDVAALDSGGEIRAAAARRECRGEVGAIAEAFVGTKAAPVRVLVVGLGERAKCSAQALRKAVSAAGRRLAVVGAGNVQVELGWAGAAIGLDARGVGAVVGETLGLLGFRFDDFKKKTPASPSPAKVRLRSDDPACIGGMRRGLALAESVNFSRRMSTTPPNEANPAWMAKRAQELARKFPSLKATIVRGPQLAQHGLVGIETVGRASVNPPCLIRIEYTPPRVKRGAKPAVLVGKTITYDTGGLSLKPTSFMAGMKHDKDGGCAVLGAMHAIASVVKPDRPVVGLLAAAENAVAGNAYRPDDVLRFANGVSVEITNTDAEGRLVLADALIWACKKEKPGFIVDLATLTGGVVVALGGWCAGVWCEDDALREDIERAADASGDAVWRLPLLEGHRGMMKSQVADIVNSAATRDASGIQGASFLANFVEAGVPWCHIDIAGTSRSVDGEGPFPKDGATGYGVRLLASLLGS